MLIKRIKNSEFARHVGVLATGSFLAQIIGLAASPILSRLYGPASYAALAMFMALVSAVLPAASGRFDIAVVVAKDDADSNGLLVLSIYAAGVISILMLIVFTIGQKPLMNFLHANSLGFWWLLTPLVLFLTATTTALRSYANRYRHYTLISKVLVTQALIGTILSIGFGIAWYKDDGQLIAALVSTLIGTVLLLYSYKRELTNLQWHPTQITWNLVSRYRQFPVFNATTSLIDGLTIALPVFFITKYFPEAVVGYFALLTRVASAPLSFIAQAISQVHIRKVAEQVHDRQNPAGYLIQLTLILAGIVSIPTFVLMLHGPLLFTWVFGAQWHKAGELLVILMPAFALRFVVSTVSGVFSSTGNNHLAAIWKITAFLCTFVMFWQLADKLLIEQLFLTMMVTDLILYSFYYYLILYAVDHPRDFK